jgi:histidinol-phosphate aminotransferase
MAARLSAGGLTVYPSEANFVLVDLSTQERAGAADRYLRSRGVIVRSVAAYGLAQCLRITIGTDQECAAVTDALIEFVGLNG